MSVVRVYCTITIIHSYVISVNDVHPDESELKYMVID